MVSRLTLYVLANFLVIVAVVVGSALHNTGLHPLYVVLLFAICASPILEVGAINDRYALLCLFSLDYFLMYGALDLQTMVLGAPMLDVQPTGIFDTSELVILAAGVLVQVAYRIACRAARRSSRSAVPMDWSEHTLVFVGLSLWLVCSRLNWDFSVHIVTEATNDSIKKGLASLSGVQVGIYMIARMAQPLSVLILAYAQCRYKRPYMTPLVLAAVIFQLIFGFIIDFKTEALIGGVLVVLTNLLVTGKVPKAWVLLMLAVVAVGFPLLQANRVVRNDHAQSSTQVAEHLSEAFTQTLAAKDKVNTGHDRAQTALERLTLKGSVETIVRGTADNVPFQHGYTLLPMLTAFIPRLLYPDKPVVPTGQIMNHAFNLSAADDTYMSPSHLGELYWNFGWTGALVGMTLVGLLLGILGARFDLSEAATITRVLVVVVTVRQVILASEGEFATQYVVWMRSMLGIGLLHLVLARVPWTPSPGRTRAAKSAPTPVDEPPPQPSFPNLLR